MTAAGPAAPELSATVVQLMKGVVYRDTHESMWQALTRLIPLLRDYFDVMGLNIIVDEAEGYAYLQSKPDLDDEHGPPRLVARRSLSFHVSLLLALLRKRLAEHDASSSDSRLVLTRDQIVDMLRVFLPSTSNEARLVDKIDSHIAKATDLGFLRRIRGSEQAWEVRRILKAFVDGQWLSEFDQRLAAYAAQLTGDLPDTDSEEDDAERTAAEGVGAQTVADEGGAP